MAWTLNLLLLAGAIVLVTYLHRTIQKIIRNAYVYPSEAFIDQVLPPEIIEQIFCNLDYESITSCSAVSKYWRHHANKEQIQDFIIRNEVSLNLSAQHLKESFKESAGIDLTKKFNWLSYPDNYPSKWILEDRLFAKNLGKQLIETDLAGARKIYSRIMLHATMQKFTALVQKEYNKYLLKLRGRLEYDRSNVWPIKDHEGVLFYVNMNKHKDGHKLLLTPGTECELILELNKSIDSNAMDFTSSLVKFRVLNYRPKFAGFPLSQLLVFAFLLLLPCLVVDYRNSPNTEAKFYASIVVNTIFGFMALIISFWSLRPVLRNNTLRLFRHKLNVGRIGTILLILICVVMYRWSLELANYCILIAGSYLYYHKWNDVWGSTHRRSKVVAFIVLCLIVLMNDWKVAVDAVKSLEIFFTLWHNMFMHMQVGVLIALQSILENYYYKPGQNPSWRDLILWRPSQKKLYAESLWALVFITVYAPTTRSKIFADFFK